MVAKNKKYTLSFFNSHLTSVISVSIALFLLGLILIMFVVGNELAHYIKENITISVVLTEDLSDANIRRIRKDIENMPYVKSTEYISKEQAAREMQHELGESPETFLGFNPFHASIEVKLNAEYTHPDSLTAIEKRIVSQASVSEVQYRRDMLQTVSHNIRRIGVVLLTLFAILILVSFVLINNTIRLLIYSRRFLIYTMRLVGATPDFIRRPFIRHNILNGSIAGILAIIMLMGLLFYVKGEFVDLEEILHRNVLWLIYGAVFAGGIVLSVVAAYFSVNSYLRMSRGKLYHI